MSAAVVTAPLGRTLSPELTRLFSLLCEVSAQRCGGAPIRVAGGWVRDMLLGKESNDIDVAIETPTGQPLITGAMFAHHIAAFVAENDAGATGTMSVIKTNPEKSKHIETAQMAVHGFPLEFCHLRHDEYTSDNDRMPEVRPGTPLEDAQRRDFCCNALYFNLQTNMVEDFCGGLHDLQHQVLRCPLDPFETFMDDPLRILRGVRFVGQLGFKLDTSISDALARSAPPLEVTYPFTNDQGPLHPLVHALIIKVSRERAAVELTKALGGNSPRLCADQLIRLDLLFTSVLIEAHFSEKPKSKAAKPDIVLQAVAPDQRDVTAERILSCLDATGLIDQFPSGSFERFVSSLCCLVTPVLALQPVAVVATDIPSRVDGCLLRWLKLPTRVCDAVKAVCNAAKLFAASSDAACQAMGAADDSDGTIFSGELRTAMYMALKACSLEPKQPPPRWALTLSVVLGMSVNGTPDAAASATRLVECIARDTDGRLLHAHVAPPLLRGDQLPSRIAITRQDTGKALEEERLFMLHHPFCTVNEVEQHLVKVFGKPST